MYFLGNPLSHDCHSLVVRILASGAGGPGSNSGGVTCVREEGVDYGTMGYAWCDKSLENNLIYYLQSKMSFEFIEISTNIC
jgi:hypothetical protein